MEDAVFVSSAVGEHLNVWVKQSKTDAKNVGYTLTIGCSLSDTCGYCSVRKMLASRHMANQSMDPKSPLFLLSSGPLTQHYFVQKTCESLAILSSWFLLTILGRILGCKLF